MQHIKISDLPEIEEDLKQFFPLIDETLIPKVHRKKDKKKKQPLSDRILSRIIEKDDVRSKTSSKFSDDDEDQKTPGVHIRLKRQLIEYYYKGTQVDSTDSESMG
ncbi:hypothetical protein C6P45_003940 [Maudiozyma exigua]|uniref:Uncharacterized protein n=1 Tax=Maudiozyma exigua TaxID=34358 RepID=A0A9P6WB61_MAUEX|nr:hypothetical protein C6P45_003940 [Kazachstania exigua]